MYEMYLKIKLRPAAFLLGRDELLKEFLVKRYINLAVEEVNRFGPFFLKKIFYVFKTRYSYHYMIQTIVN
jgi:hypothetical protein